MTTIILTPEAMASAVRELVAADEDLHRVVERVGPPPMWARRPGFATLVRIILEQQVSLASADATYRRLQRRLGRVTAARVGSVSVVMLRRQGVTRQKAEYIRHVASLVVAEKLNLEALTEANDATVCRTLVAIRGIGPWTADIYLLMALRRPDVWPRGDLALRSAAQAVKRLRSLPSGTRLQRIATAWRPWRSVAARILWHHYLHR